MKLILLGICLLFALNIRAQNNYSVDLIPKMLFPYASMVIRTDENVAEIKDKENILYHIKVAYTILNASGDKYAGLALYHNKFENIKSVKGTIYDELGKVIGKITEGNFEDSYVEDGFSLFQDAKYKHYRPSIISYPYTVEYEYEIHSKQTMIIYPWYTITSPNIAVQNSSSLIVSPPTTILHFKEINYPGKAAVGLNNNGMKTYFWQVNNLKAIKEEPYSLNKDLLCTSVHVTTQDVYYDHVAGSYINWKELGKFTYDKLLEGRDKLPPQTIEEIKSLIKDVSTEREQAKKIYEYMQRKCRYVSIQIGIGGYQPFPASDVDMMGYGDCKGLVNYTQALLKAANINSYYCVVKAGSEKVSMLPDFASMDQGNHVILCLPFKNDTTWLECTSKNMPFGFLGSFTDDRDVLACTPNGGKLMHTPKYTATQNREDKVADFNLLADGSITGTMNTNFTGRQYEYRNHFLGETYQDRVKNITKEYPINNMEIENLRFEPAKEKIPAIKETIKFKAPEYAATDNGKLVFIANAANRIGQPLRETHNRISPLYINRGFTDDEKITYILPSGYSPDNTPLNVDLHKKYGSYKASVSVSGNQLIYTRSFQLLDGTFTKDDYNDFVDFYQSVYEADHYTVTLVKK